MEILELQTEDRNGPIHIAFRGELDLSTVGKVQDELRRVEASAPAVVVLDLSKLTFLDSTGLRCLVTADERRLFEVIKRMLMKDPFDRFQTCEELIASFQNQPIAAPGAVRTSLATAVPAGAAVATAGAGGSLARGGGTFEATSSVPSRRMTPRSVSGPRG